MSVLCTVEGCKKSVYARVYCASHWYRWNRHGDPLAGKTAPGVPQRYLAEIILPYDGDDCLTWPFGRTADGYGGINIDGNKMEVHRVVCIEVYGLPPSPTHQAAHSCGKGREGCVNPHHLRWATPAENTGDKHAHGTVIRGADYAQAKLSERQVREIMSLRGIVSQRKLALAYNVSRSTISMIHLGENWGWLTRDIRTLEVRDGTE